MIVLTFLSVKTKTIKNNVFQDKLYIIIFGNAIEMLKIQDKCCKKRACMRKGKKENAKSILRKRFYTVTDLLIEEQIKTIPIMYKNTYTEMLKLYKTYNKNKLSVAII